MRADITSANFYKGYFIYLFPKADDLIYNIHYSNQLDLCRGSQENHSRQ